MVSDWHATLPGLLLGDSAALPRRGVGPTGDGRRRLTAAWLYLSGRDHHDLLEVIERHGGGVSVRLFAELGKAGGDGERGLPASAVLARRANGKERGESSRSGTAAVFPTAPPAGRGREVQVQE